MPITSQSVPTNEIDKNQFEKIKSVFYNLVLKYPKADVSLKRNESTDQTIEVLFEISFSNNTSIFIQQNADLTDDMSLLKLLQTAHPTTTHVSDITNLLRYDILNELNSYFPIPTHALLPDTLKASPITHKYVKITQFNYISVYSWFNVLNILFEYCTNPNLTFTIVQLI